MSGQLLKKSGRSTSVTLSFVRLSNSYAIRKPFMPVPMQNPYTSNQPKDNLNQHA